MTDLSYSPPLHSHNSSTGRVLVTGGTGFIGAYVIKNLVEKGITVRAIKRATSRMPFFIPASVLDKVEWVEADVLDVMSLDDAMKDVQSVIHAAAIVSFAKDTRLDMYKVNVEGTANVVNIAIENEVKRFIHISSISALGRTVNGERVDEKKKWEESKSNTHYGISKRQGEIEVWRGFEEGLTGAIVNPSTVLGFGDWHTSSSSLFRNVFNEFPWYTTGINGFVGVEDVAETTTTLLLSGVKEKKFIVNSENWSFQQLFNTIAAAFNKTGPKREATKVLGEMAWRIEAIKSKFTGIDPILTRETAKIAQTKTYFDGSAILPILPGFTYTPLTEVIQKSCEKYLEAVKNGSLTP